MLFQPTAIQQGFIENAPLQYFSADEFPTIHPVHWLHSHFAVGGWSPLQRLSGMLTAHMTRIAPRNGFTWHPHRGLEIYTWVLEGQVYHEDTTGGKGVLQRGDLQRMFSGDYIEHQELNPWDEPARVIQIWFAADRAHRGLPPHYQQLTRDALPVRKVEDATIYSLIGDGSPMEQHMQGRLTALSLDQHGKTTLEAPHSQEELFLYVTDGAGTLKYNGETITLAQYDVIIARPDMDIASIQATDAEGLHLLNFYLQPFMG